MRAPAGSTEKFLRAHADYNGDDCVLWPFASLRKDKGYGAAKVGGVRKTASRWMCILAHGDAPSDKHEAAHNCGNTACVNPKHIRWATPAENSADKDMHGTMARGARTRRAKLSPEEVLSIRKDTRFHRIIAAETGISMRQILRLKNRDSWSHL